MNYHNITKDDMLNGDGLRVVLWVSGCNMNCIGCQNPETHNPNSGILFDNKAEDELFNSLEPDYISGLTLSGGHPLDPHNLSEVKRLVLKFKDKFPNKTIWLYTGYTWEQIQKMPDCKEIVDLVDVLVDGKYMIDLHDTKLKWRGSLNQRVIDVQKSLQNGKIVLYCD